MNKSIFFLGLFVICLLSCEKDEAAVRLSANAYLEARLQGDFTSASQWVAPESRDRLEDLEMMVLTESEGEFPEKFTLEKVIWDGDKASVLYALQGYGQDTLDLVLQEEKWLVDLSSASAVPDAGMLWHELRELEESDTTAHDLRAIERSLLEEDSLIGSGLIRDDNLMPSDSQ